MIGFRESFWPVLSRRARVRISAARRIGRGNDEDAVLGGKFGEAGLGYRAREGCAPKSADGTVAVDMDPT